MLIIKSITRYSPRRYLVLTRINNYDKIDLARLLSKKTIELVSPARKGRKIHPNCLFTQRSGNLEQQLGCLIPQNRAKRQQAIILHTAPNHNRRNGGVNLWLRLFYPSSLPFGKNVFPVPIVKAKIQLAGVAGTNVSIAKRSFLGRE